MQATRSFEITKNGNNIKFEITATKSVMAKTAYADGYNVDLGNEVFKKTKITVYLNGELYTTGEFVKLSKEYKGAWAMVDGRKRVMVSPENQEKLERLMAEAEAEVETEETKEIENGEAEKENEIEVEVAKEVVRKFESGKCVKTEKELKEYNDLHNEGGEGYAPELITERKYQAALKTLKLGEWK